MSDDEGDIVVMQVCAGVGCSETYNLQFDEKAGELFCPDCMAKLRAAEENRDFRVLLSPDDRAAIRLIFDQFDTARRGYWSYKECNAFHAATAANRSDDHEPFQSDSEMAAYFGEEYDVPTETVEVPARAVGLPEDGIVALGNVLTLTSLERMYGGYMYHGVNALRDDVDALEDAGEVNFDVLE